MDILKKDVYIKAANMDGEHRVIRFFGGDGSGIFRIGTRRVKGIHPVELDSRYQQETQPYGLDKAVLSLPVLWHGTVALMDTEFSVLGASSYLEQYPLFYIGHFSSRQYDEPILFLADHLLACYDLRGYLIDPMIIRALEHEAANAPMIELGYRG